jgi:hypothetical protein
MKLSSFTRAPLAFVLSLALFLAFAAVPVHAADLTVTATSVVQGTVAVTTTGTAGEALTAGQMVYKKAADGRWYKGDCNSATAEVRVAKGVALNGAAAGQPAVVQTAGQVTIGATLTAGTVYYLSGTPGGIRPAADNTTGDYPQAVGMAISTTVLLLDFNLASPSAL